MNISHKQKQFWMSNVVIVISLLGAVLFPAADAIQSIIISIAFLIVLPLLFTYLFLKERLPFLGLSWGNVTQGSLWLATFLSLEVFSLIGLIRYTDALSRFDMPLAVRLSFPLFILFIVVVGIYVFMAEFFFRGFVFSVWQKNIGTKALFAQTTVYLIFLVALSHWKIGASFLVVGIMALLSGFLVIRSRSIVYSFLFSYISVILGIVSIIFFVK